MIYLLYSIKYDEKFTLNINIIKEDISKSHSVTIYPEEEMKDKLSNYSNMPMKVDNNRVEELIEIITDMLKNTIKEIDPYNKQLLYYIKTHKR
jgi:uncharacterized protein YcbK (DUF882 family)